MKKYLLGLFAVALAIGFSAFSEGSKSKPTKIQPTTNLYWYVFDGTNITAEIGSGAISKSTAESDVSCNDNPLASVCAYGYTAQQTGLPKPPGSHSDSFNKSN